MSLAPQAIAAPGVELLARSRPRWRRRGWLVRRALCAADLAGLTLAYVLAQRLFSPGDGADVHLAAWSESALFALTLPVWVVVAKLYGLYDHDEERTDHSTADDVAGVFHMITVGAWLLFAGGWLLDLAQPQLPKLVAFWALAIVLVVIARSAARAVCRRQPGYVQKTIVVGAGQIGQLVARKLRRHPEYGIELLGFVDAEPLDRPEDLADVPLLGDPASLPALVDAHGVERVIVAFSLGQHKAMLEIVRALSAQDVQVDIIPRFFELLGPGVGMHTVEGLPLVGLTPPRLARSSRLLKRAMDVVVSSLLLALLAPAFAVAALLIKRDSRGPVFFRQLRVGAGGRPFHIVKFRTMAADAEERKESLRHLNAHALGGDGRLFKIADDPRVTRVGSILRRYCLDELPQLWNVLHGEMTLVGPRPLVPDEDRYVDHWARGRLDLKPGMTGPWQVLGSNRVSFQEMLNLDYLYVTGWSLWNDFLLMARTLPVVARGGQY